jgi:hypothetical protein
MDIVGDRKFVELPGGKNYELPPLLVGTAPGLGNMAEVLEMAMRIIEREEMLSDTVAALLNADATERRKMDLALNLVDHYLKFVKHWQWGNSIVRWIGQCEITFNSRTELSNLLSASVWPHAGLSSFVQLLEDKHVEPQGVNVERAVGTRLSFVRVPPIKFFSNQFLLYLEPTLANTAYQTWSHQSPPPVSSLPPERFSFDVVQM